MDRISKGEDREIENLDKLIDKFDNTRIKGLTECEQMQVFSALGYFDMYQKIGTIEDFMKLKSEERLTARLPAKKR